MSIIFAGKAKLFLHRSGFLFLLFCQFFVCIGSRANAEEKRRRVSIEPLSALVSDLPEFEKTTKVPIAGTLIYDLDTETKYGPGAVIVFQLILPTIRLGSNLEIFLDRGYPGMTGVQASPDGQHILLKKGIIQDAPDHLTYFLWHKNNPAPYKSHRLPADYEHSYVPQSPLGEIYNGATSCSWSPDGRYLIYHPGAIIGSNGLSPIIASGSVLYDVANDKNLEIEPPFSDWTPRGTLLGIGGYSRLPKTDPLYNADQENFIAAGHSSLYEFSLTTRKMQLIVQNAFGKASMTADGRWVIFQGWADLEHLEDNKTKNANGTAAAPANGTAPTTHFPPEKPVIQTTRRGLYLYDTQEKKRYLVQLPDDIGPFMFAQNGVDDLRWAPDGKTAVLRLSNGLYAIDPAQRAMRHLTVLTHTNGKPDEPGTLPLCEILGFSDDSQYVVVCIKPKVEWQYEGYYPWADVRAVNVQDGSVTQIVRINKVRGVSWVNTTPPPAVVLTPQALKAQTDFLTKYDAELDAMDAKMRNTKPASPIKPAAKPAPSKSAGKTTRKLPTRKTTKRRR